MSLASAFKHLTVASPSDAFTFHFEVDEDEEEITVGTVGTDKKKAKKKKKKKNAAPPVPAAEETCSNITTNDPAVPPLPITTIDPAVPPLPPAAAISTSVMDHFEKPLLTTPSSDGLSPGSMDHPPLPSAPDTSKHEMMKSSVVSQPHKSSLAKSVPSTTNPQLSPTSRTTTSAAAKSISKPAVVVSSSNSAPRNLKAAAKKQKAKSNKTPSSAVASPAKPPPAPRPAVQLFSSRDLEITDEERRQRKYGKGVNLVAIGPQPKVRDPHWADSSNKDSDRSTSSGGLHSSPFSFGFGF